MKRRSLLLYGLLLCALGGGAGWIYWHSEPMIHGHRVTYWCFPGYQHPKATPEATAAAFAAMDARCVRFLTYELDWRPSQLSKLLNATVGRLVDACFGDREDNRYCAALALARLGPRAASAIPALERCARQAAEPRSEVARGAALAAWLQLTQDPLTNLLARLSDPSDPDWTVYALAAKELGPRAVATAPVLAQVLASTNNFAIRGHAAWALASVQAPPEVTLPALRAVLGDRSEWIRRSAVSGLGQLGRAAKPAWLDILPLLNDPELGVRLWTTNAVRQIDPEAARQLGVN
jgi:hypothetical protein